MDIYRQESANEGCKSHPYWLRLRRQAGKPDVDCTRLKDLHRRERVLFYPKNEVEKILKNQSVIKEILSCRHECCKKHLVMDDTERNTIVDSVLDKNAPKIILLAILIFLGKSYMIAKFSKLDNLHDGALLALPATDPNSNSLYRDMWSALLDVPLDNGRLSAEGEQRRDVFLRNYHFLRNLFDIPVFSTQHSWVTEYTEDRRLPFLDDELHVEGADTVIRKFNIHPQYLDVDMKYTLRDWYRVNSKHKFARKILRRRGPHDRLERRLEMNSLKAMSAQDHNNIIELLFVFEWRNQFSFVFPFVERDLRAVLHGAWQPVSVDSSSTVALEQHWLWTQMIQVASGLKTIHQPEKPCPNLGVDKLYGFHFDLKPANILVTDDGILKITDFGQALLKIADADGSTYGIHRGGSLIYQPPEASSFSPDADLSKLSHQSRRYDVWSFACIMFEVLRYILAGGAHAGKGKCAIIALERARKQEPNGEAYYTYVAQQPKLKGCILSVLAEYGSQDCQLNADQAYLSGVSSLLKRMFSINPKNRPTSSDVHKELELLSGQLPFVKDDKVHIQSLMDMYPIPRNYEELGWSEHGWCRMNNSEANEVNSFLYMKQVRLLEIPTQSNIWSNGEPCHLRISYDQQKNKFLINTFGGSRNENFDLQLDSTRYFPMHNFQGSSTEKLRCALSDGSNSVALSFGTHDLLKNFQTAMTQHQIVNGSSYTLDSLSIRKLGTEVAYIVNGGSMKAQIWAFKQVEALNKRPSIVKVTPVRIVVFDCNNRQIFNLPLNSRTCVPDVVSSERTTSRTFTIHPNLKFGHHFFHFSISKANNEILGPSLPLSRSAYENLENFEKAKSVELKFLSAGAMRQFSGVYKAFRSQ